MEHNQFPRLVIKTILNHLHPIAELRRVNKQFDEVVLEVIDQRKIHGFKV